MICDVCLYIAESNVVLFLYDLMMFFEECLPDKPVIWLKYEISAFLSAFWEDF